MKFDLFQSKKKTSSTGRTGGMFGKTLLNGATSAGLNVVTTAGEAVGKTALAVGSTGVNVATTGVNAVGHVAVTGVNAGVNVGKTIVSTASGGRGYLKRASLKPKAVSTMDIFCSDFYTEEFVLQEIEKVRQDPNIVSLNFEDLMLRECPKIYNKATELLMDTAATFDELIEGEDPEMGGSWGGGGSFRLGSGSSRRGGSFRRSSNSIDSSLNNSKGRRSNSGSRRSNGNMDSSWHNVFSGASSRRNSTFEDKAAMRLWKIVSFTDAVSDADDYVAFVRAKAAFQKRLILKNMTTKVPIKFIAKIELHNMMSVEDVFELLQEVEKDTAITSVDFRRFERNPKTIPSEFAENFDIDAGEWKEGALPIEIMLYYGKEDMLVDPKNEGKKKKISIDVIRRCRMKLLDNCVDTDSESEGEGEGTDRTAEESFSWSADSGELPVVAQATSMKSKASKRHGRKPRATPTRVLSTKRLPKGGSSTPKSIFNGAPIRKSHSGVVASSKRTHKAVQKRREPLRV